ncbi:type II secretion system protein [Pelomonas sp. UHG3]|uniref:Type II secretion system protein n=2 Tax=Roseateles hydrophilus TaxID=2975054 RepID=A0ACC6C7U5_9BURK|nr:type II secretion system protein [Pelomonas sp. UHG3]
MTCSRACLGRLRPTGRACIGRRGALPPTLSAPCDPVCPPGHQRPAGRQRGFTLLELVMAIVILGVLGAFALPGLIDTGSQARVAQVNSTAGAVATAVSIAASKCVVTAGCNVRNWSLPMRGPDRKIGTMFNGYPTGQSRLPSYFGIRDWVDVKGVSIHEINTSITQFRVDTAPDPMNCMVIYHEVVNFGEQPSVTKLTSGC